MSDIGKKKRHLTVTPKELPLPQPLKAPEPIKVPELVPA